MDITSEKDKIAWLWWNDDGHGYDDHVVQCWDQHFHVLYKYR